MKEIIILDQVDMENIIGRHFKDERRWFKVKFSWEIMTITDGECPENHIKLSIDHEPEVDEIG